MVWSTQDKERAASENWTLADTVEGNKLQLRVFGLRGISNVDAMRYVWNSAGRGSAFHQHALRCVTQSLTIIKRGKK